MNPADDPGVFLGDKECAEREIPEHLIVATQWDVDNPGKALAIMQNVEQFRLYHQGMHEYLQKHNSMWSFGLGVGKEEGCWRCAKGDTEGLKNCARCKVAYYCSR